MSGTRWPATTVVLATAVLATAVTGMALLAGCGGGHRAAATPPNTRAAGTDGGGARTPGVSAVRVTITARLPVTAVLTAVSCPSARLCMAIGATPLHVAAGHPPSDRTVVLRWNGTRWAHVPVPRPATGKLSAIWCGSATSCLAVGDVQLNAAGSESTPLTEWWDGHSWTIQPVPSPAHAFAATLAAIDCASPTACTAVGDYSTARTGAYRPSYPLAEGWNGAAWRLERTAGPVFKGTVLSSVSCSSARACTAVGTTIGGYGPGLLAERWNGTAWAAQRSEPSGGGGPGDFSAVSCPLASSCTAVGDSGGDDSQGLTEIWHGRGWGSQAIVDANGSTLSGVTCMSGTRCLAVGSVGALHGNVTLAALLHGSASSVQHTANVPRPALDNSLEAITCASPSACMAVGGSDRGCCTGGYATHQRALAEWWNGTKWRMLPTPSGR